MLEHLDREEASRFLKEALRVLQPGGVIRLVVPDIFKHVTAYNDHGDANKFIESTHMCIHRPRTFSQRIRFLLVGTRHHQWMYDGPSLSKLLESCGFVDAAVQGIGQTIIAEPGALDLHERSDESCYVEASKPI